MWIVLALGIYFVAEISTSWHVSSQRLHSAPMALRIRS
jgi:hypothetical protein